MMGYRERIATPAPSAPLGIFETHSKEMSRNPSRIVGRDVRVEELSIRQLRRDFTPYELVVRSDPDFLQSDDVARGLGELVRDGSEPLLSVFRDILQTPGPVRISTSVE